MLNISLRKIFIYLFSLLKVGTILANKNQLIKTNQQIQNIYIHTLNKIKHKCWNLKIALQTTKNPYALHAEQVHGEVSLCFNSSLL